MDVSKDMHWLNTTDQHSAIIVPTRGLLNTLNEQFSSFKIAQGESVWEAPNLLVWADYLNLLWHGNRHRLEANVGSRLLISSQQSLLLWTQVIESSRRKERELTLLNVQQTARAVQRSWRLMNDWRVSATNIEQDHVADIDQFLLWLKEYLALLEKRSLIDEPLLIDRLCQLDSLEQPFAKITWHAYDLVTAAQEKLNTAVENAGTALEFSQTSSCQDDTQYLSYVDTGSELRGCFEKARELIEKDPQHTINIVIPDLSQRLAQVRELAREVFYPSASPLQVQQNKTAYRFSLGQPLAEWAAIETALSVIGLLNNRSTVTDIGFLLRNQFLALCSRYSSESLMLDRWLKKQRMRTLLIDNLPDFYQRCLEDNDAQDPNDFAAKLSALVDQRLQMQQRLQLAKESQDFAALTFSEWIDVFSQWLTAWGWHTKSRSMQLNTVQHQLYDRWASLLEEFSGLATVQKQAGLKRAIELLQQMARDTMFLPKSVVSPILISSLLEAIGRPADTCMLTGMNQAFPPPPKSDAFVPARLLSGTGNPDADPEASYQQASKVITSVLNTANNRYISYAELSEQDRELHNEVSPLFRLTEFESVLEVGQSTSRLELDAYIDIQGSAWPQGLHTKGGSRIFENQSKCAFKAFATHQLSFEREDEVEFGLDALDRGNVVHHLLDLLWAELESQAGLLSKSEHELTELIDRVIDQTMQEQSLRLNADKQNLLKHEKPRLRRLLKTWLMFESKRPQNFSVIEREESRFGEFAGIQFKYIIDRVDMTDDGATFVVDYKTGTVNRSDWVGDRIKSPQLPLYAVVLDKEKREPVSGIAFAKVNQSKHEFVELSQANVFKGSRSKSFEQLWQSSRSEWEAIFSKLAQQFLAGAAKVDPIDEETCRYCELGAVCRISQLQKNSELGSNHEGLNDVSPDKQSFVEGRQDD